MEFIITTHQDEDGVYITKSSSIPGSVSQGITEAEKNILEAIKNCLEVRVELDMALFTAS